MAKVDKMTPHESTWIPILWALKLLERARTEKKILMGPRIFATLVTDFEDLGKYDTPVNAYA